MIEVKNLHKFYEDLHVLNEVNLTIEKGEIVSVVGASGAGKTTLLQILGTLDTPSKKHNCVVKLNNSEVNKLSKKELAKFRNQHIGFIFQFRVAKIDSTYAKIISLLKMKRQVYSI